MFIKPDTNMSEVCGKTVGSIFKKNLKTIFYEQLLTGLACKINCKDSEKVYVRQTSQALRSRTKEHKRTFFTGDRDSLLAQHCMQNSHEFKFDNTVHNCY